MRRMLAVVLALCLVLPVWSEEAPTQINLNVGLAIPGFGVGPVVDFLSFPFGVQIGTSMYNWLGWGGSVGALFIFSPEFGIAIPIQGIFVGRFGFIPAVPIDWDARLGLAIGAGGVVFFGSSQVAVQFRISSLLARMAAGVNFTNNPYYSGFGDPQMLVAFMLDAGIVLPLHGFKTLFMIKPGK